MDGFFLHLLVKALQLKEPVFFLPPPVCKTQPRNCQWSFFFLHFCCVLLSLVSLSILTIGPKAASQRMHPAENILEDGRCQCFLLPRASCCVSLVPVASPSFVPG